MNFIQPIIISKALKEQKLKQNRTKGRHQSSREMERRLRLLKQGSIQSNG